jgi:hypothetical protein
MKRLEYQLDNLDLPRGGVGLETYDSLDGRRLVSDGEGNLISSKTDRQVEGQTDIEILFGAEMYHLPVIDIDHPCRLVESSTPGHFHLYIDVPMKGVVFFDLLRALADAGVVEEGYARVSEERGEAFVRKPGVQKATR